ncbi:hypothetical protein FRC02_010813 [Tulasnella sp. 418]|nr:hypothetical protein FRC02_010813 [Tulasnella sp. 418]
MALKVQSGGSGRSHIDGGHGPPAVSTPYTACYCEENVYLLGEALCRMFLTSQTNSEPTPVSTSSSTSGCKIYAVIISNPTKSIAVFEQLRSSRGSDWDYLVVWDYHVILCLQLNAEIWVYDADSRLGSPCKWDRYTENTFRSGQLNNMVDQYRCIFRVVPMGEYLANFASDRSHMIRCRDIEENKDTPENSPTEFLAPPPTYPAIVGPVAKDQGMRHNLMSDFVDMEAKGYGTVITDVEFLLDTSWMDKYWVEVPPQVLEQL